MKISHGFHEHATACEHCDWVNAVPPLKAGQRLRCERCGHVLVTIAPHQLKQLWLNSLSATLMLAMSLIFPFIGFSAKGTSQQIQLLDCVTSLINQHYLPIAIIVTITLLVLPLAYLVATLVVCCVLSFQLKRRKLYYRILHSLKAMQPWLMADVFMLGGLVAVIKLHSMADINLGLSFWAFCAFALLLIRTISFADRRWLWHQLAGAAPKRSAGRGSSASQGLKSCLACGALASHDEAHCPRCGHQLSVRHHHSLQSTLALLLASMALYIPANVFPIMTTTFLGSSEPSTIIGGVVMLWGMGSYPVALVILIASVLVPVAKMLALIWLCWQSRSLSGNANKRLKVFHVTEFVGRWSMVDVFVVAILSALVQLGSLMNIVPGIAAVSFGAVVILTMLAAMSFDPRLLWDSSQEKNFER